MILFLLVVWLGIFVLTRGEPTYTPFDGLLIDLVAGFLFVGPLYHARTGDYWAPALYLIGTASSHMDRFVSAPLPLVVLMLAGSLLEMIGIGVALAKSYRYISPK